MRDIGVITRLHYATDDPKFPGRLNTYQRFTLPSLLAQTDSDFDIVVWCEPHHEGVIRALSPRIRTVHADCEVSRQDGFFRDFTPFSAVRGMPRYPAQLGLDSDDELSPGGIARIRPWCTGEHKAISMQPVKRDVATGELYRVREYADRGQISPVFCLYQPEDPYLFAYEYGHGSDMFGQFDCHVYLNGLATMNVHGANESTKRHEPGDELMYAAGDN